MYKIILHPTDLREQHFDLSKQAATIAEQLNATLHLLHVIEPPPSYQLAQGLGFAEIARPIKEDALTVMRFLGDALSIPIKQQHVEVGSVKKQIIDMVNSLGCDLVIIGKHHTTAIPAFIGSTAYSVIHHCPCAVLTLKAEPLADE